MNKISNDITRLRVSLEQVIKDDLFHENPIVSQFNRSLDILEASLKSNDNQIQIDASLKSNDNQIHNEPVSSRQIQIQDNSFIPSDTFQHAVPGSVFKSGAQGLGYYKDIVPEAIITKEATIQKDALQIISTIDTWIDQYQRQRSVFDVDNKPKQTMLARSYSDSTRVEFEVDESFLAETSLSSLFLSPTFGTCTTDVIVHREWVSIVPGLVKYFTSPDSFFVQELFHTNNTTIHKLLSIYHCALYLDMPSSFFLEFLVLLSAKSSVIISKCKQVGSRYVLFESYDTAYDLYHLPLNDLFYWLICLKLDVSTVMEVIKLIKIQEPQVLNTNQEEHSELTKESTNELTNESTNELTNELSNELTNAGNSKKHNNSFDVLRDEIAALVNSCFLTTSEPWNTMNQLTDVQQHHLLVLNTLATSLSKSIRTLNSEDEISKMLMLETDSNTKDKDMKLMNVREGETKSDRNGRQKNSLKILTPPCLNTVDPPFHIHSLVLSFCSDADSIGQISYGFNQTASECLQHVKSTLTTRNEKTKEKGETKTNINSSKKLNPMEQHRKEMENIQNHATRFQIAEQKVIECEMNLFKLFANADSIIQQANLLHEDRSIMTYKRLLGCLGGWDSRDRYADLGMTAEVYASISAIRTTILEKESFVKGLRAECLSLKSLDPTKLHTITSEEINGIQIGDQVVIREFDSITGWTNRSFTVVKIPDDSSFDSIYYIQVREIKTARSTPRFTNNPPAMAAATMMTPEQMAAAMVELDLDSSDDDEVVLKWILPRQIMSLTKLQEKVVEVMQEKVDVPITKMLYSESFWSYLFHVCKEEGTKRWNSETEKINPIDALNAVVPSLFPNCQYLENLCAFLKSKDIARHGITSDFWRYLLQIFQEYDTEDDLRKVKGTEEAEEYHSMIDDWLVKCVYKPG